MNTNNIPNILAQRYAGPVLREIWSAEGRIRLERDLWIAVLKAQRELGLDVPEDAIAAYEAARDHVDLQDIQEREALTRHDVKARIESFCAAAGHEHIHKGMTSRDLTENVEQYQVLKSLEHLQTKAGAVAKAFAQRADEWKDVLITGRTHNVAAQPTTLGKRMAMFGEEHLQACLHLDRLVENYSLRGLKGAVGTQMDQLTLFDGDTDKAALLEDRVTEHLGFKHVLNNVGQVYPRSMDFEVVSMLFQLGSGASSFARTLRIMAGHELASEGFAKGQVGSSAMPHKMNSRSCERINGFHTILRGHVTMASGLAGDQWNEGDVSCSVVRRVVLPDAFFAIDGLLETALTVLGQMQIFPRVIEKENLHYGPFLATTTILMEAVQAGAGRETAHEAIKEHAVATVLDLREGRIGQNDLATRLAHDSRLGLSLEQIQATIERATRSAGRAYEQVEQFKQQVEQYLNQHPEARSYKAGDIL